MFPRRPFNIVKGEEGDEGSKKSLVNLDEGCRPMIQFTGRILSFSIQNYASLASLLSARSTYAACKSLAIYTATSYNIWKHHLCKL